MYAPEKHILCIQLKTTNAETEQLHTFFSMEHRAKLQPCRMARLQISASIHSDFPELGTPVTMDSSPGTTWMKSHIVSSQITSADSHDQDITDMGAKLCRGMLRAATQGSGSHPVELIHLLPASRHCMASRVLIVIQIPDLIQEV